VTKKVERVIVLKTAGEIEIMREAGAIVASVLEGLKKEIRPSVKTRELNGYAEEMALALGAKPAFKGYHGYPYALCVSVNEEVIHGMPSEKKLSKGDIVSIDFGVFYKGFCGDAALTISVGDVSDKKKRLLDVTETALMLAVANALPGGRLGDISAAIQGCAEEAGFSVVREFVGHGIGRRMHEEPTVPNFGKRGQGIILKEGMVLAIEPMINAGSAAVCLKDDGWTVITADGSLSAHFEHTVAITKSGPLVLSKIL